MAKPYDDKKWNLGDPAASMLRDFLVANYRGTALELVREAVQEHIQRRLDAEPIMRERYERARRIRLNISDKVVQMVPKSGGSE